MDMNNNNTHAERAKKLTGIIASNHDCVPSDSIFIWREEKDIADTIRLMRECGYQTIVTRIDSTYTFAE